jgi:GT2 family glycosyltransferase
MTADQRLTVSVCIPTFNRRRILLRTLRSLGLQDEPFKNFEVIVGDDGSHDGTLEAVSSLRVPYRLQIFTEANAGPAAATNLAARHAVNDILVLLDDDQIASPGLIRAHIEAHQRYGDIMVQGLFPLADECRSRGSSLLYESHLLNDLAPCDVEHPFSKGIWSANVSVRRESWQRVGGLDETFREYGGEDTDFGIRVAASGCPMVFVPNALSYHVHLMSYEAAQRQPFQAGRAMVRLAQKFEMPVESVSGWDTKSPLDRVVRAGWLRSPRAMVSASRVLTSGLVVADLLRWRPAQMAMARCVHRLNMVGGITRETKAGRSRQLRTSTISR